MIPHPNRPPCPDIPTACADCGELFLGPRRATRCADCRAVRAEVDRLDQAQRASVDDLLDRLERGAGLGFYSGLRLRRDG